MGSLGVGFVLWIGGKSIISGSLSYGTFVMFIAYTVQFFDPISHIAGTIAELQNAQASAERIISLIETKPDILDDKYVCFTYKNGEKVITIHYIQISF